MKEIFDRILNEYNDLRKQSFSSNPFGMMFKTDFVNAIYNTGLVDKKNYVVKASIGQGNWVDVPWLAIFRKDITTNATEGVYIAYFEDI